MALSLQKNTCTKEAYIVKYEKRLLHDYVSGDPSVTAAFRETFSILAPGRLGVLFRVEPDHIRTWVGFFNPENNLEGYAL